jgi:DNA-binding NtrC family response regulator
MLRPRLILVEDNPLIRWWLNITLGQQGFDVAAPASVDELEEALEARRCDVLVTDCNLEDCRDGFHVLETARGRYPQVFAVLMSAQSDADLPCRARNAGFDAFLAKPVRAADIARVVGRREPHGAAEATL